jgi:GNAT superfamily N-acetyltransferase
VAVREAMEADVSAVVDVYIQAYAQPPWNERHEPVSSEGYLRWVLSQPGAFTLVSEDGARQSPPQGIVMASPRDYGEFVRDWERLAERPPEGWPVVPGRLGYIWEIAVRPEAQRRGHGTALLRGAVDRDLGCVVVPDRHGEGTNALLLCPPDAIEPAFGPGSRERHTASAAAADVAYAVEEVPTLALDIDTGQDLELLVATLEGRRGQAPSTRGALRQLDRLRALRRPPVPA